MKITTPSSHCRGYEYVEQYLASPYVFMTCVIKHRDNFAVLSICVQLLPKKAEYAQAISHELTYVCIHKQVRKCKYRVAILWRYFSLFCTQRLPYRADIYETGHGSAISCLNSSAKFRPNQAGCFQVMTQY